MNTEKVYDARLNRDGTKVLCGGCNQPIADWIEGILPGSADPPKVIRQVRLFEGYSYNEQHGRYRTSGRVKKRRMANMYVLPRSTIGDRRFDSRKMPLGNVKYPVVYTRGEAMALFTKYFRDVEEVFVEPPLVNVLAHREQVEPPLDVECTHCRGVSKVSQKLEGPKRSRLL